MSGTIVGTGSGSGAAAASARVQFLHPAGHANVRPDLDALLGNATVSLRAAVCFFTRPGRVILDRHIAQLQRTGSFFVASVDCPTDLHALNALHQAAPGNVYIHLGGTTPEEPDVGRSLMHSKVFLAEGGQGCHLWVGSHNLTAMAMEGGNFEAGVTVAASASSQVMLDAVRHLEACRDTAELFTPAKMDVYEEIQRRRRFESEWVTEKSVLVVHAETTLAPTSPPFMVHIQVEPTDFDPFFRMDRPIRLFLHALGTLKSCTPVDYRKAALWAGAITAVVRTERHPKHRGTRGQFPAAQYEVDIPNVVAPPVLLPAGQSTAKPSTQVVIRIEQPGESGAEVFALNKSPIKNVLEGADPVVLHEADRDMLEFFTDGSHADQTLLYRPVVRVREVLSVVGYEETQRSALQEKFGVEASPEGDLPVSYEAKSPRRPIDPFFFLSEYVIRPRRDNETRSHD